MRLAVFLMLAVILLLGFPVGVRAADQSITVTGSGTADMPVVTLATPDYGLIGEIGYEVVVTGDKFTGTISVSFGTGIIVDSFLEDSDDQITCYIDIDLLAAPGFRDITVTTSVGIGTGVDKFEVLSGLPLAPTDFLITQTGVSNAEITWVLGVDATTTIIRGKEGSYPTDIADGYEVYNGAGTSVTATGLDFKTNVYCYRAWSYNGYGYSEEYAENKIGGGTVFMFIGLVGFAIALGFFAYKVRFIVVSIASGIAWLALAAIAAISPAVLGLDVLSSNLYFMLAIVFLMMAFTPLLFQMRTDIKHESLIRGHPDRDGYPGAGTESWTSWGPKPTKTKGLTSDDRQRAYKDQLRRRTGRK